ncbi:unnamed protein product, partial [Allacma fusca]
MCVRKEWSEIQRKKREPITLITLLIGAIVVSAGIGIASVAMASTNKGEIKEITKTQQQIEGKLDELEAKVKNNTANIL